MSPETTILLALCVPLAGALLIGLAGRVSPNLRETMTLGECEELPAPETVGDFTVSSRRQRR